MEDGLARGKTSEEMIALVQVIAEEGLNQGKVTGLRIVGECPCFLKYVMFP